MLIKIGERFVNPAHIVSIEWYIDNHIKIRTSGGCVDVTVPGSAEDMNTMVDRINNAILSSSGK